MRSRPVPLTAALLLAGALGVHELRYVLAFGGDAESALSGHGHGYLMLLTPVLGSLTGLGLAIGLLRAAAAPSARSVVSVRLLRLWPVATAALLAIYVSQEVLEGLVAPAHPPGWAGVFGSGGWVAVPLAVAFGAVVAIGLRVARAVQAGQPLRLVAIRVWLAVPSSVAVAAVMRSGRPTRLLADHLAGRAPPFASV